MARVPTTKNSWPNGSPLCFEPSLWAEFAKAYANDCGNVGKAKGNTSWQTTWAFGRPEGTKVDGLSLFYDSGWRG